MGEVKNTKKKDPYFNMGLFDSNLTKA